MIVSETICHLFSPGRVISAIAGQVPPKAVAVLLAIAAAALVALARQRLLGNGFPGPSFNPADRCD
jgi:hypothetical protein